MLFRMGVNRGIIKIDDRDISELKLKDLRSSISVIPQVNLLFFEIASVKSFKLRGFEYQRYIS